MLKRVWTFLRNSWLAYKGVSLWLNPQAYMIEKVINPIFRFLFYSFLILYGYKEKTNIAVFILGNAILLSSISALEGIGILYFSERQQGTLMYFIVSPRSRLRIIAQKIFSILSMLSLQY
ncbi:MAG: hypothetical protein N2516_03315 [Dictyoglomaceae bacterium]|nr:hypothetical protein [Dictyoglomaceae bacterium]